VHIISDWIDRHPVLVYFLLTFLISWGGVLILGAPYGMPTTNETFTKVWPIVFLPYFLGPTIAGLLMTGIVSGRLGLRALLSRLRRWRVGIGWYATALLTAPLLVGLVALLLSMASRDYLPAIATADDKVGLLVTGVVVGLLFGGFLEELGWTGFAVPRLRQGYAVAVTGLIVGGLHALWHVLPTFWATGDASGAVSWPDFLPPLFFYAGVLPAYRILMVWVYDATESLLVSMLMHASLTASAPWILLPVVTGISLVIYYLVLIVAIWIVVALVLRVSRGQRANRVQTEYRPAGAPY
jgi:membrane protease YdiL (CAAX protease family)